MHFVCCSSFVRSVFCHPGPPCTFADRSQLALVRSCHLTRSLESLQFGAGDFICAERRGPSIDGAVGSWPRAREPFQRPFDATRLQLHDDVDAMDRVNQWYQGVVVKIEDGSSESMGQFPRIMIHFKGWAARFDEWFDLSKPECVRKLAPCSTHTNGAYIPPGRRSAIPATRNALPIASPAPASSAAASYLSFIQAHAHGSGIAASTPPRPQITTPNYIVTNMGASLNPTILQRG
jgi:hypothetical protein